MAILSGLAFQHIAFDVPNSGAKSVCTGPMVFDGASVNSFLLDPTQNNQLLEMQNIQSVFVDNFGGAGTLTVTVSGTGHVIRVPPKAQCFMPLICGDRPNITFAATAAGTAQAWLLNIPALGIIWTLP